MLIGAIVFSSLISSVQSVQYSRAREVHENALTQARTYLRACGGEGVPSVLERRCLAWLDYDTLIRDEDEEARAFLSRLPAPLLKEVLLVASNGQMEHVQLFRVLGAKDPGLAESLALECYGKMELRNYYPGTQIAAEGDECTELLLIQNGHFAVEHVVNYDIIHTENVSKGGALGEWALLGDTRWMPEPKNHVSAHTENLHNSRFLHIYVNAARGITAMDLSGTSDAFVILKFAGKTHKTRVVQQTCEPEWKQRFQFEVSDEEVHSGDLRISVWDKDYLKADDLIGSFSIPLSSISRSGSPSDACPRTEDMNLGWYAIPSQAGNIMSQSMRLLAGNAPVAAEHAGEISLGLHIGAAAPLEAMTRVVSGSFVTCRALTRQSFDAILAGRPSNVRAQLKEFYANVVAEESVPLSSSVIAGISGVGDSDLKTRASEGVEVSQTPRALRMDLKSFDVSTATKGVDGQNSEHMTDLRALMADVRDIKARLWICGSGSVASVDIGHGHMSAPISARSAAPDKADANAAFSFLPSSLPFTIPEFPMSPSSRDDDRLQKLEKEMTSVRRDVGHIKADLKHLVSLISEGASAPGDSKGLSIL